MGYKKHESEVLFSFGKKRLLFSSSQKHKEKKEAPVETSLGV